MTKQPDPEGFSGRVKAQAGEDNYYDGEVELNIPLGNDWAAVLHGFAMTDDSYLVNPNTPRLNGGIPNNDPDVGQLEKYGVRAGLAGSISEQLSLYATLRYNEYKGPNNIWNRETDGNLTHTNIIDTSYNARHDRDTVAGSIELTYDFGNFDAIYLTSYTDTDSYRETDLDIDQEFVLDLTRSWPVEVWTHELRFTSTDDSPLQWQAGAYYLDWKRHKFGELPVPYGFCFFLDPSCNPNPDDPIPYPAIDEDPPEDTVVVVAPFENLREKREQVAGFANFSYRMNNIEIGGGVRVDRWDFDATNDDSGSSGSQSNTEILGRASVSMFFDDDRSMVYALFSQGFEPGSFNAFNLEGENDLFPIEPEEATQVEIGYKGRLLGDRLILTMAGFYIDYEGRQFELQTKNPQTSAVLEGIFNVGDSEQWGFEGDMILSMHENWTLSAGVGYVDAEWVDGTEFLTPTDYLSDLSGRRPPNTVKWSATAALDYDQQVNDDMRLFGRLQLRYKGDASTNAQLWDSPGDDFPFWENPDFAVVDLGAGMEWNNWEFGIHVENLFDEEYYIDVQEFPNFAGSALPGAPGYIIIGTLEQPRRVVGSVQYHF